MTVEAAAWPSHVVRTWRAPDGSHWRELAGGLEEPFDPVTETAGLQADTRPNKVTALPGLDLDLLGQPPAPLRWLVEGRITAGTLTVLASKPGVGKSWLSQDAGAGAGAWTALARPTRGASTTGARP